VSQTTVFRSSGLVPVNPSTGGNRDHFQQADFSRLKSAERCTNSMSYSPLSYRDDRLVEEIRDHDVSVTLVDLRVEQVAAIGRNGHAIAQVFIGFEDFAGLPGSELRSGEKRSLPASRSIEESTSHFLLTTTAMYGPRSYTPRAWAESLDICATGFGALSQGFRRKYNSGRSWVVVNALSSIR
jgi:hypothetical protein